MEKVKKLKKEFWLLIGIVAFLIASTVAMAIATSTVKRISNTKDYLKSYNIERNILK